MEINLAISDHNQIKHLRIEYLDMLPEPQELFLEMMVRESEIYSISADEILAGYCMVGNEQALTEFYIKPAYYPLGEELFQEAITILGIRSVWVKSFDRLILSLCLDNKYPYDVVGYMFRKQVKECKTSLPSEIEVRTAGSADIEMLWEENDGYFETREEIEMIIQSDLLFSFYKGEKFIGCGTIMHIFPGGDVYDVGMMTAKAFRRQGIGTGIISYLVAYCRNKNWRPNFGCAADNTASRKTLEKAGFVTRDRILKFNSGSNR